MSRYSFTDKLGKCKPTPKKVRTDESQAPRKVRKKQSWITKAKRLFSLERSPEKDIFISEGQTRPVQATKPKKRTERTKIGDFLIKKNKELAETYKDDLEDIAFQIPGVTFFRDANETSAKELKSILDKLNKRAEMFEERGYHGIIRDGVRARIFMPDADKNYTKIIEAMEKKRYKVADTFAEDSQGNIILNVDGTPKMIKDIDVRFGKNACDSGYEDVQIRFEKNGVLYELIVLPGPHYMSTANREHELIYEQIRKYKSEKLDNDPGAKQIIKGIEKEFHKLTRQWYADASLKDRKGTEAISTAVSFEPEDIKTIDGLFKSLKNMFSGRWNALPPSKKNVKTFKETKAFQSLDEIEKELRKVMDMFKPAEEVKKAE